MSIYIYLYMDMNLMLSTDGIRKKKLYEYVYNR